MIDWRSVPYPPWCIARAAGRRRELDAAVERLRAVVAQDENIVGALVFGSYATGTVGPGAISMSCSCTGSQNVRRSFENGRSSRKSGAKAGGLAQQHPRELAGNWLEQARRDLDAARYLFDRARYDAACFAAQQAAEKALKAALIWLAGDRPRTHQLTMLIGSRFTPRRCRRGATRYPDAIGGGVPGASFFAPEGTLAIERASRAVAYVAAQRDHGDYALARWREPREHSRFGPRRDYLPVGRRRRFGFIFQRAAPCFTQPSSQPPRGTLRSRARRLRSRVAS